MKRVFLVSVMLLCLCAMLVGCGAQGEEGNKKENTTTSTTKLKDKDSVLNASTTVVTKAPSESNGTTATTEPKILPEEQVKWYALFCAGETTDARISDYTCRLTYHEERECQVYEISFKVGRTRFEYVFRATDCDIIVNKKIIGEE